jgi:hypothetical protein
MNTNVKCPKCQTPNPANARFCRNCGTPLAATCVHDRTVALTSLPASTSPPAIDSGTISRRVQQAFGTQSTLVSTGINSTGNIHQREHTGIVIDHSWSMDDEYEKGTSKLEAAIRAAVVMICNKAQIDPHDEIGLVAFNSTAQILLDLHPISSHKRQMIQEVQALSPANGTDINEGLVLARDMFDWSRNEVVRRIVLLTDGEGGDPLQTAEDLKDRGVVIDVIGIGDSPKNVNVKLLKKVASVVGGELRYRFIKDQQTLIAHYTQLANKTKTSM